MAALRSDAVRSRERILDAARAAGSVDLRLNEVARTAGVGVGTVYRHFPSVHALVEALSLDTLRRLHELATVASASPDIGTAFPLFLCEALTLQLDDGFLQEVLVSSDDETDEARALKTDILAAVGTLIERAREIGALRADLGEVQVQQLICGLEHAIRLGAPADRELFFEIFLAGIAAPAAR